MSIESPRTHIDRPEYRARCKHEAAHPELWEGLMAEPNWEHCLYCAKEKIKALAGNYRRIEHDGVIVLLPTSGGRREKARLDRQAAHALLWIAGEVNKGV